MHRAATMVANSAPESSHEFDESDIPKAIRQLACNVEDSQTRVDGFAALHEYVH
jgi:hypothetical protein